MGLLLMAMGSFVLVGAITPGPVNVLALRHGVTSGRGGAGAYVLGASVGYAAVVWLRGVGGELVLGTPWVMPLARWGGATYLLYLALGWVFHLHDHLAMEDLRIIKYLVEGINLTHKQAFLT